MPLHDIWSTGRTNTEGTPHPSYHFSELPQAPDEAFPPKPLSSNGNPTASSWNSIHDVNTLGIAPSRNFLEILELPEAWPHG